MLPSSELRDGNWILDENGNGLKVYSVRKARNNFSYCNRIPISATWLIMLGFNQADGSNYWRSEDLPFTLRDNNDGSYSVIFSFDPGEDDFDKVYYVHHVQNYAILNCHYNPDSVVI